MEYKIALFFLFLLFHGCSFNQEKESKKIKVNIKQNLNKIISTEFDEVKDLSQIETGLLIVKEVDDVTSIILELDINGNVVDSTIMTIQNDSINHIELEKIQKLENDKYYMFFNVHKSQKLEDTEKFGLAQIYSNTFDSLIFSTKMEYVYGDPGLKDLLEGQGYYFVFGGSGEYKLIDKTSMKLLGDVIYNSYTKHHLTTIIDSLELSNLQMTPNGMIHTLKKGEKLKYRKELISLRSSLETPVKILEYNNNYLAISNDYPEGAYLRIFSFNQDTIFWEHKINTIESESWGEEVYYVEEQNYLILILGSQRMEKGQSEILLFDLDSMTIMDSIKSNVLYQMSTFDNGDLYLFGYDSEDFNSILIKYRLESI